MHRHLSWRSTNGGSTLRLVFIILSGPSTSVCLTHNNMLRILETPCMLFQGGRHRLRRFLEVRLYLQITLFLLEMRKLTFWSGIRTKTFPHGKMSDSSETKTFYALSVTEQTKYWQLGESVLLNNAGLTACLSSTKVYWKISLTRRCRPFQH